MFLGDGNPIAKVSEKCVANDLVAASCSPPFPNQNLAWYKIKLRYKISKKLCSWQNFREKNRKFTLWKISIILWLNGYWSAFGWF